MSLAPRHPDSPGAQDPVIPARLSEALRRQQIRPADLGELDEAVLANASRSLARRRSMLLVIRAGTGLAAAAAIALAIWGGWMVAGRSASPAAPAPRLAMTTPAFDPSKHVTIIDAFTLARLLDAHKPTDPPLSSTWDVNHDGRIDQQDVDLLAHRAVKLSTAASHAPTRSGGAGGGT